MLEQKSTTVTFYAQFLVLGAKGTGLTVTCSVYKGSDGSTLVSAQAATELGSSGVYRYVYSGGIATKDELLAVFNEAAETADQTDVAALWVVGSVWAENLDANVAGVETKVDTAIANVGSLDTKHDATDAALAVVNGNVDDVESKLDAHVAAYTAARAAYLDKIGTGVVTVVQPVSGDGETLSFVRGDDYKEADARGVSFSSDDWPNLTGATAVKLTMRKRVGARGTTLWAAIDHKVASFVPGVGNQTVVFEPTKTHTASLEPGTRSGIFDVEATLASGHIVTLVTGTINVTEDQTRV